MFDFVRGFPIYNPKHTSTAGAQYIGAAEGDDDPGVQPDLCPSDLDQQKARRRLRRPQGEPRAYLLLPPLLSPMLVFVGHDVYKKKTQQSKMGSSSPQWRRHRGNLILVVYRSGVVQVLPTPKNNPKTLENPRYVGCPSCFCAVGLTDCRCCALSETNSGSRSLARPWRLRVILGCSWKACLVTLPWGMLRRPHRASTR